jgi:hypothetical protein
MLVDLLYVMIGGVLVTLGVIASALSDRIRGLRTQRVQATARRPIEVEVIEPEVVVSPRAARQSPKAPGETRAANGAADDVIAALVAAGYKAPVAREAVWGCTAPERETIESWTASALRRAMKGGMS